jgi:LysM repeat protein
MTAALFPDFAGPSFDGRSFEVRSFEVRLGNASAAHAVYVRRRLAVALIALGLIVTVGVSARAVLADRGGVPASTPAVRSASADPVVAAVPTVGDATAAAIAATADAPASGAAAAGTVAGVAYIVQPGDTLWSLAERFHATTGISSYLDDLVEANGGASIQPGQLITLP